MDHVAIIRSLGGAKALSDALTARGVIVAPVTARSWSLTGRTIPAKYWTHVVAIAAEKDVEVSFEALATAAAAEPEPAPAADETAAPLAKVA